MPRLDNASKIVFYENNYQFKLVSLGEIGTRNHKSKPLSDLFQCHKSSGGLRFVKRATIEKHIF